MLQRFPKINALTLFLLLSGGTSFFFSLVFTVNMFYQVTTVGLDPLQLVLVGTGLEVSVFLFEIPTGIVADLYSRRLSIIIGTALIGCGLFLEGLIPAFAAVLAGQFLWGLGYTFTSGATQAWIVDEVGEANLGSIFIRASQVSKVGGILGTILSPLLASILINLPIMLGGILFILMALLLLLFMPETGFKPVPREERSTWRSMIVTFREGAVVIRRSQILQLIAGLGLFYGLYSEGYDRLWTPHLVENIGLPQLAGFEPVLWFGVIGILNRLLGIIAAEIIRRRVNTEEDRSMIQSTMLVSLGMIITLAIFALAFSFPLALIALLAFDVLRGITEPLYTAWMNRYIPSNVRATVISTYGQIDAFGQIGGGPLLGLIGQRWGVRAGLLGSAAILSPILLLYARLYRSRAGVSEISPEATS